MFNVWILTGHIHGTDLVADFSGFLLDTILLTQAFGVAVLAGVSSLDRNFVLFPFDQEVIGHSQGSHPGMRPGCPLVGRTAGQS